jgi:hypothetical protein
MPDFVYSYDWYDGPRPGVTRYEGKPYFLKASGLMCMTIRMTGLS